MAEKGKLITLAIHTYEHAKALKDKLEKEGIEATIHNVDLSKPIISSGVRVRIHENDLPLALKIIEQPYQGITSSSDLVIIPIDFSDYSLNACTIGFDFAHSTNAKVVLLHTYLSPNHSGSLPFDSDRFKFDYGTSKDKELESKSAEKMEQFARQLHTAIDNGELPDIEFSTVIKEGVPEDCIIDFAKKNNTKIVVMGTRGKDKKQTDSIGSVTAEVLDSGKFPVFSVPENISLRHVSDIKNVAFLNTYCQQDLISFDLFVRLFHKNKLTVSLIPVLDKKIGKAADSSNSVLEYCNKQYPNSTFEVLEISENDFINEFSQVISSKKIDLIVIPNKKRNIFARLFNPSVAHKMLFLYDTPLLVIPI